MPIYNDNPEWPFSCGPLHHYGEVMPMTPHSHIPLHSSIGAGPGLYRVVDQAVNSWLDDHRADLNDEIIASLRSFYKKYEASYVTTEDTKTIRIPIEDYHYSDILLIDINGLDLVEGDDYVIQGNYISLNDSIESAGQVVHFVLFRAITIKQEDFDLLKGDKGEKGEPGEKGDTFTYDDLTEEQKQDITSKLNSFYRKSEASFVTAAGITTEITIPIEDYRPIDILFVDVNGLSLVSGTDYSVNDNKITLSTPITNAGSIVNFTSLRAVEIDSYGYEMLKGERGEKGEKGDPGTVDYADLENKPAINSVKLDGDLSLEDIGISIISNNEIDEIVSN